MPTGFGRIRVCGVLLVLASLMATSGASAQSIAPRDSVSAVLVGHSLINFDMPFFLQSLADSRGLQLRRAVQVLIGSPLSNNLANCRRANSTAEVDTTKFTFSCDAIDQGTSSGPYDTLILTDANNTIASNRQWNRTDEAIATYARQFLTRNSAGRILLFTSWESLATYGSAWSSTQAVDLRQYEEMAAASSALARASGNTATIEVIPVNIAIRDLLAAAESGVIPNVNSRGQIFSDDVHMTQLGNYFVAAVVFAAIYNRTPEGASGNVPGYLSVPSPTALALQRLAWQVVSTYRGSAGSQAVTPRAPTLIRVD